MHKAGILSVADTLDKVNCTYINPCAHNSMVVFAEYIRMRLRCASELKARDKSNQLNIFACDCVVRVGTLKYASRPNLNIFACDCVVRVKGLGISHFIR